MIGLVLTAILVVKNVRGAILIGIVATTVLGIFMGVVDLSSIDWQTNSLGNSFKELEQLSVQHLVLKACNLYSVILPRFLKY